MHGKFSEIKRRRKDELAPADDAPRGNRSVGVRDDRLEPAALSQIADIELNRGADLVAKKARAVARERIDVKMRFVVKRSVGVVFGDNGRHRLFAPVADRSLVLPAQRPADVEAFQDFVGQLEFDKDIGEAKAYQAIGKMKSNIEASRLLVRMIIAIASSDGLFDNDEKKIAIKIAKELGINPSEFEL